MNFFDEDPYAPQEDRRATVKRHLARLRPAPKPPEPHNYPRKPEHLTFPNDFVRFVDSGQVMTVTLAAQLGYKIPKPHVTAGDPDGDRDVS